MEPANAMGPPTEFRLFAQCLMDNPTTEEFQAVEKYLPLLKAFQTSLETRTPTQWDFTQDFVEMAQRDLAAWEQLGATRLPQFVRPSGDINSSLALHLLNPTFHVADAQSIVTDDPTSPTINELHLAGLSSQHCFMFDEISRRDRTDDCLHFYTEDIRRIHKDFVRKLRENMSAVVEICFGEEVFQAVQRSSHLVQFPLWGKFKSVRLWLELEDSESILKRFVIHAYHPSFFFRSSRLNKSGPSFDDAYRRPQELMIIMAVQLAGLNHLINVKPQLLGNRRRSKADIRLTTDQNLARKENLLAALNAFKVAFPAKFKRWELKASCNQSVKSALSDLERSLSGPPVPMQTHHTGLLSVEQQTFRINARREALNTLVESFQSLKEDLTSCLDAEIIGEDNQHSDEYVSSEAFDYDSIPAALWTWLKLQDGLKIHGQPLNSRESLEVVFSLLRRRPDLDIKKMPVGFLAQMVAILYIRKMTRPQSQLKKKKCIPAEPGSVIHLKCYGCNRPSLDNAFPFVLVDSPDRYVAEVTHSGRYSGGFGCGRSGCKGEQPLIPENSATYHTVLQQRAISASIDPKKRNSFAPMFRAGDDLKNCAQTILVRCNGPGSGNKKIACGRERRYERPRWTIHSPARFLVPRLKCSCDGKDHYFQPVDQTIQTIRYCEIRKIWNGFAKVGCNLADYPKIAEYIFPTKSTISYKEHHKLLIKAKKARDEAEEAI